MTEESPNLVGQIYYTFSVGESLTIHYNVNEWLTNFKYLHILSSTVYTEIIMLKIFEFYLCIPVQDYRDQHKCVYDITLYCAYIPTYVCAVFWRGYSREGSDGTQ